MGIHDDSKEQSKRKLYAGLDVDSGETFFASLINQKGMLIEFSSSWKTSRGKNLILIPIPQNWDGTHYTAQHIRQAEDKIEGHVSRAESRGQFQLRLLSNDQQDLIDQMRSGRMIDNLTLERTQAGLIDIIKLSGRVSVEGMGRIQSAIKTREKDRNLILLDVQDLVTIPGTCLGVLHTLIKEEMDKGLRLHILYKTDSRVQEEIEKTRIPELAPMFDEYELAVADLLQSILD